MSWFTGSGAKSGQTPKKNDAGGIGNASSGNEMDSGSVFARVDTAPQDPVFAITNAFKADPNPKKVNMGVGAYRNDEGEPFLLNIVKKVELELVPEQENTNRPEGGNGPVAECFDGVRNCLLGVTNTGKKANKEYCINKNQQLLVTCKV